VTSPAQRAAASELRRIMAAGRDIRELVEIGAYVPGTNPDADRGLALRTRIDAFLRQGMSEQTSAHEAWTALALLLATEDGA
jgi:flagellum-specific ATP synthase